MNTTLLLPLLLLDSAILLTLLLLLSPLLQALHDKCRTVPKTAALKGDSSQWASYPMCTLVILITGLGIWLWEASSKHVHTCTLLPIIVAAVLLLLRWPLLLYCSCSSCSSASNIEVLVPSPWSSSVACKLPATQYFIITLMCACHRHYVILFLLALFTSNYLPFIGSDTLHFIVNQHSLSFKFALFLVCCFPIFSIWYSMLTSSCISNLPPMSQ